MGTYSKFVEQEIEVVDHAGLKKLVDHESNQDNQDLFYETYDGEIDLHFEEWDGHKLESYWHNDTVNFLRKVAKHVTGYVEFEHDNEYKFRIVFEDGKALFQRQPFTQWEEIEKGELQCKLNYKTT